MFLIARGAPCAKTTASMATLGTSSRTIWRAARPTAGARTPLPASATATRSWCSRPPSGMAAIRSSRSACSACSRAKATTAKTSSLLQIQIAERHQSDGFVGRRGAHVGQLLLPYHVHVQVVVLGILPDDHALINFNTRSDEQ